MWQKNNGQNEADQLQNQFTAYLSVAIQRRRNEYITQLHRQQQVESLTESPEDTSGDDLLEVVLEELPLLMRLENDALLYALKELNERERSVFLARVLDGLTFEELADRMHLSYKGVAAIYYRALRKIRQKMTEVDHEF